MYAPYGTHNLAADLRKAGVPFPENIIDWWKWIEGLRLKSVWRRLHDEGCMIAGITGKRSGRGLQQNLQCAKCKTAIFGKWYLDPRELLCKSCR